ncbi:hypothetical protein KUCAC02_035424 [Chaenocephalus aceratus]|nr:hypothetical protein KUCAC02_035424 [Chaenocephalus aceratus]
MTIAAEEAAFTLHVKCYAHTLNLAAQRALKITAVARLLGRVRRIVNFFRRSTTANHMLKEKQRLLQLPEHKLMTDVVTRWNSAHDMLDRFLEQQPAICAALLSSELEEVVSTMKPMKEATQYMSKEKTSTLSVIAPLQDTLINGLKPIEAMDPRFKSLPFLTENQRQEVYDGLIAEAQDQPMPSEEGESSQGQHPPPRGIQSRLVHWLPFLVVNDTVVEHNPRQIPKRTRPRIR